jgi:hypothetical protein
MDGVQHGAKGDRFMRWNLMAEDSTRAIENGKWVLDLWCTS